MFKELFPRFPGSPVLVVGDLMLDEFVWGAVSRISPEAPVPVVEVQRRTFLVGGAGNTAANIGALRGRAILAGVVGADAEGEKTRDLLATLGVDTAGVVADESRPTTTKTRVVAQTQQVVRIDREAHAALPPAVADELLARCRELLPTVRACVVSDYGKGVVTAAFAQALIGLCRAAGVPVVVDPKGVEYRKYRGATVVKPNQLEAGKVLNRDLRTDDDIRSAGADLSELLGPDSAALITRGPHGMTLFERGREPLDVPAQAREVYDVTGAGDTVAGTMALALAGGGDLAAACRLASVAAAVVVGKVGTATCSLDELRAAAQVVRWEGPAARRAA